MIRTISNVLSAQEILRLRELAQTLPMIAGTATNPGTRVKDNLQVDQQDPASAEPGVIVRNALVRSEQLRAWTFPRQMARPTLAMYRPDMKYGWHVDEALFPSQPPIRSDISCTVFVSDPQSYEGGELEVELGGDRLTYKLAAGDAVLYPSTTIHQVRPVTSGQRIVAITWIHSYIADAQRRETLIQLEEARALDHLRGADERLQVLLAAVRANLFRMWADT